MDKCICPNPKNSTSKERISLFVNSTSIYQAGKKKSICKGRKEEGKEGVRKIDVSLLGM